MQNKSKLMWLVFMCCLLILSWCSKQNNTTTQVENETSPINTVEEIDTQNTNNEIANNEKDNTTKEETKEDTKDTDLYIYENKEYWFTVSIPQNWTFKENEYNFSVILYTPKDDNINENLGITVQTPQIETNINEYYSNTISKLKDNSPDFKELSNKDIQNWKTIVYETTQWSDSIKAQQTIIFDNQKNIYVLQYTATKETFDKYINSVNKIIDSFKPSEALN